jgi:hypothetical protein
MLLIETVIRLRTGMPGFNRELYLADPILIERYGKSLNPNFVDWRPTKLKKHIADGLSLPEVQKEAEGHWIEEIEKARGEGLNSVITSMSRVTVRERSYIADEGEAPRGARYSHVSRSTKEPKTTELSNVRSETISKAPKFGNQKSSMKASEKMSVSSRGRSQSRERASRSSSRDVKRSPSVRFQSPRITRHRGEAKQDGNAFIRSGGRSESACDECKEESPGKFSFQRNFQRPAGRGNQRNAYQSKGKSGRGSYGRRKDSAYFAEEVFQNLVDDYQQSGKLVSHDDYSFVLHDKKEHLDFSVVLTELPIDVSPEQSFMNLIQSKWAENFDRNIQWVQVMHEPPENPGSSY